MNFRKTAAFAVALIVLTVMAMGAPAPCRAAETPDWFFHDIVDAAFVQQYAKVPQPKGVMIIDSRPYKAKYVKGHIPTAVSIPDSSFDKMIDKLPEDKNTTLVFYCGGPT
jgi:3-mercaptopyruvate sulfurtransferase SseA